MTTGHSKTQGTSDTITAQRVAYWLACLNIPDCFSVTPEETTMTASAFDSFSLDTLLNPAVNPLALDSDDLATLSLIHELGDSFSQRQSFPLLHKLLSHKLQQFTVLPATFAP